MVAGFTSVGVLLVFNGLRGLSRIIRRRPYLLEATGRVVKLERVEPMPNTSDHSTPVPTYRPVVEFETISGERKRFASGFGADRKSLKLQVGSTVPVLYDHEEVVSPMIHSWASVWGSHLILIAAGLIFLGGSALTYALIRVKQARGG
jgi:hypothetical protein